MYILPKYMHLTLCMVSIECALNLVYNKRQSEDTSELKRKGARKMSTNEITAKIEALKAIEDLIEEAKAEAETLRDELKREMLMRDTEELTAGQYIVRWTSVLSQRFDTTAFKRVMPEVYKAYTKQVSSRRFSISA